MGRYGYCYHYENGNIFVLFTKVRSMKKKMASLNPSGFPQNFFLSSRKA